MADLARLGEDSEAAPSDAGQLDPEPAAAPAATLLEVEDLSKQYAETRAVDRLSFAVRAGEILGLVGPNGAGKTTTLRTIAGVLPIQSGRVAIAGYDLATAERRAKLQLAWVPDDPQPFEAMTVDEHLEFTAALYRVGRWRARAEELLARFELLEKRGALGGELSRGMRQKLAFCCAWLPRPRVVLLDEPLSGLDPHGIRSAKAAIRDLAAEGSAIVLSSHLLDLVEELGTHLLVLRRGRKVYDGTMEGAHRAAAAAEGTSLEEVFFAVTGGELGRDPERATATEGEAEGQA
ncbi:ABC-type transporter ATP-binding protein EcsA [Planctomycetes bacterium Pla86]|uniref:ABC-type transporter ATP-binding protein EcsA n=2 Tax=Engelhardtia mirabilis TaxID=2528011 RepID=A0A518BIL7_9BACT|nr:ABC-type transporter ATP-binding protein EcsA [Planctomycetes bacterium Pla133]QDV01138.1 ABC-type transporter ATP-binding protein EcsA [Planctomycetes bacterium Pla86]